MIEVCEGETTRLALQLSFSPSLDTTISVSFYVYIEQNTNNVFEVSGVYIIISINTMSAGFLPHLQVWPYKTVQDFFFAFSCVCTTFYTNYSI